MGLESTKTTLTNAGPCVSGGVCGDTKDVGGQVCLNEGLCEESVGPLSGWVISRFTGPSQPSEITCPTM